MVKDASLIGTGTVTYGKCVTGLPRAGARCLTRVCLPPVIATFIVQPTDTSVHIVSFIPWQTNAPSNKRKVCRLSDGVINRRSHLVQSTKKMSHLHSPSPQPYSLEKGDIT